MEKINRFLCLTIFGVFLIGGLPARAATWNDTNCDWCNLEFPDTAYIDGNTASVYGQILVIGYTDSSSTPVPGILAEIGYGPHLSDPTVSLDWIWRPAMLNLTYDFSFPNDEYVGMLAIFDTGTFSYTYRYSRDAGASWTLADLDGAPGIDVNMFGTAYVYNPSPTPIPSALWLLGSGLIGIVGGRKKFKK